MSKGEDFMFLTFLFLVSLSIIGYSYAENGVDQGRVAALIALINKYSEDHGEAGKVLSQLELRRQYVGIGGFSTDYDFIVNKTPPSTRFNVFGILTKLLLDTNHNGTTLWTTTPRGAPQVNRRDNITPRIFVINNPEVFEQFKKGRSTSSSSEDSFSNERRAPTGRKFNLEDSPELKDFVKHTRDPFDDDRVTPFKPSYEDNKSKVRKKLESKIIQEWDTITKKYQNDRDQKVLNDWNRKDKKVTSDWDKPLKPKDSWDNWKQDTPYKYTKKEWSNTDMTKNRARERPRKDYDDYDKPKKIKKGDDYNDYDYKKPKKDTNADSYRHERSKVGKWDDKVKSKSSKDDYRDTKKDDNWNTKKSRDDWDKPLKDSWDSKKGDNLKKKSKDDWDKPLKDSWDSKKDDNFNKKSNIDWDKPLKDSWDSKKNDNFNKKSNVDWDKPLKDSWDSKKDVNFNKKSKDDWDKPLKDSWDSKRDDNFNKKSKDDWDKPMNEGIKYSVGDKTEKRPKTFERIEPVVHHRYPSYDERPRKKYERNRDVGHGRTPIPFVGKRGIYEDKK